MIMRTFGQIIKEVRKDKRITQRDLAKQIDVDFTYISKIENEALEPPSEEVIIKIAKTLEIDENELFLAAKKVPTEFKNTILEENTANMFFRRYSNLTSEQKQRIDKILEE